MNRCRVLLVDDSRALLDALGRLLALLPQVEVVGQARSAPEALDQAARSRPDLVIMDLAMPGMSGLEATRRLKAAQDGPLIVVLTLHDDAEHQEAAQAAGADGFLDKRTLGSTLLPLVRKLVSACAGGARPAGAGRPAAPGAGRS